MGGGRSAKALGGVKGHWIGTRLVDSCVRRYYCSKVGGGNWGCGMKSGAKEMLKVCGYRVTVGGFWRDVY